MHASLLTELTEASVCLSVSVREREGVCVHTYKSSSLRGGIQDILSVFFASDIFIYVPLMGTARRENTELSAFQQVTVAKSSLLEFK